MPEIEKYKDMCDLCEGLGYYHSSNKPSIVKCENCEGTGDVIKEREKKIRHEWVPGEWKKDEQARYYVEHSTCKLCGCIRTSVKPSKKSEDIFISTYVRSKQIFGKESMPECWGAKNPQ